MKAADYGCKAASIKRSTRNVLLSDDFALKGHACAYFCKHSKNCLLASL